MFRRKETLQKRKCYDRRDQQHIAETRSRCKYSQKTKNWNTAQREHSILASTGLFSFSNFPLLLRTFTAEMTDNIPKDPSNIPASTTVSYVSSDIWNCQHKPAMWCSAPVEIGTIMKTQKKITKWERITKWEPIKRAGVLMFFPWNRPCTFPM